MPRLVLILVLLVTAPAAAREKRVALMVGADAYRAIPALSTAVADARAVATQLRTLGFEVVGPVLDPARDQFNAALDRFEGALRGAALGGFFCAGHAVEVTGRNRLLPVGAQEILASILGRTPRAVMMLDTCRDNPLLRDPVRGNRPTVGGNRGLESIETPRRDDGGSLVVLAAAPGEVALDRLPGNDCDPNGPFTRHLLCALAKPARPLPALVGEVGDAVAADAGSAGRRHMPEITDRMVGNRMVGGSTPTLAALPVAAPAAPAIMVQSVLVPQAAPPSQDLLDLTFWQSIQDSRSPTNLEAYLQQFPQRRFAALASNRLAALRAPPATAPPPSPFPVGIGESFRDCAECPEVVVIPTGRFKMGSPSSETGRDLDEGPQREVSVLRSLAVGKFEVTFAEWDACVAASGCSRRPSDGGWGRGSQPVMNISWGDAQEYVRWLSLRTGRGYRLLTEAEWEYAARAGTTTPYSFGFLVGPSQANYSGGGLGRTQAVGSYPANAWGLHDMHGNVWEWVQDAYFAGYAGAPSDASQAVESAHYPRYSARILRGGSWDSGPQYLRSALRLRSSWEGAHDTGFRVARTPDG